MSYDLRIASFYRPNGENHIEYKIRIKNVDDQSWGELTVIFRYSKLRSLYLSIDKQVRNYLSVSFPGKKLIGNTGKAFVKDRAQKLEKYLRDVVRFATARKRKLPKLYAAVMDFLGVTAHEAELFKKKSAAEAAARRRLELHRSLFARFDADSEGYLGPRSVVRMLRYGYKPTYIDRYKCLKEFGCENTADVIDQCWVTLYRFKATLGVYASNLSQDDLEKLFRDFDRDGDGVLRGRDLDGFIRAHYYFHPRHVSAVASIFGSDGVVRFDHFRALMDAVSDNLHRLSDQKSVLKIAEKLTGIRSDKRSKLVSELRDIEGAYNLAKRPLSGPSLESVIDAAEALKNAPLAITSQLDAKESKTPLQPPLQSSSVTAVTAGSAVDVDASPQTRRSVSSASGGGSPDSTGTSSSDVVRMGYLQKRGRVNTAFQRRFFRLFSDGALGYTDREGSRKERGRIQVQNCDVLIDGSGSRDRSASHFLISEKNGSRVYVLKAESAQDRDKWMKDIQKVRKRLNPEATEFPAVRLFKRADAEEGWLEKRGKMNTAYKNRYFRLDRGLNPDMPVFLSYYKTKGRNAAPMGSIELKRVQPGMEGSVAWITDDRCLNIKSKYRTFTLMAQSRKVAMKWIGWIYSAIRIEQLKPKRRQRVRAREQKKPRLPRSDSQRTNTSLTPPRTFTSSALGSSSGFSGSVFFEDSDEESRSGERTLSHITQRSVNSSRMETPLKMSFQKKVKSVHVVGASLSSTQRSPVIAERLENGTAGRVVGSDASSRGSVYNSVRERFVSDATSSDEEGSEEEDETASTVQTLQKWTSRLEEIEAELDAIAEEEESVSRLTGFVSNSQFRLRTSRGGKSNGAAARRRRRKRKLKAEAKILRATLLAAGRRADERRAAQIEKERASLIAEARAQLSREKERLRHEAAAARARLRIKAEETQRLAARREEAWRAQQSERERVERLRLESEMAKLREAHEAQMAELSRARDVQGETARAREERLVAAAQTARAALESRVEEIKAQSEAKLRKVRQEFEAERAVAEAAAERKAAVAAERARDSAERKAQKAQQQLDDLRRSQSELHTQLEAARAANAASARDEGEKVRELEAKLRAAAAKERTLASDLATMQTRVGSAEAANARMRDALSTLEAMKADIESEKDAAAQREALLEQRLQAAQSELDASTNREEANTRALEAARVALESQRTADAAAAAEGGVAARERLARLEADVKRLASTLDAERERSQKLREGQSNLRKKARGLVSRLQEREARMRQGYEEMKAKVKARVLEREAQLVGEIQALKGHLSASLASKRRAEADLIRSRARLAELEVQHTREELAWVSLKRELTEEENERRAAQRGALQQEMEALRRKLASDEAKVAEQVANGTEEPGRDG